MIDPFVILKSPECGVDGCYPCANEEHVSTDATHSLITPGDKWKVTGLCAMHAERYRSATTREEHLMRLMDLQGQRDGHLNIPPQLTYVHKVVRKLPDGRRISPGVNPELDPKMVVEYAPDFRAVPLAEGHLLFAYPFRYHQEAMAYAESCQEQRLLEDGEEYEVWDAHAEVAHMGTIWVPLARPDDPQNQGVLYTEQGMTSAYEHYWRERYERLVQGDDPTDYFRENMTGTGNHIMGLTTCLCSSITLLVKRY